MIKRLSPLLAIAAIAAAISALVFGPGWLEENDSVAETPRSDRGNTTPVILDTVILQAETTRIEAVGTSRARRSVTLYPAVPGEVTTVNFEPGQLIAAGDVLVELDRRNAALALELAEVRLADARRQLQRYERSVSSGAVTTNTLDTARTAVQLARIERDQARVALDDRTVEAPFDGYIGITDVDPGDRIGPDTTPIATLDDRSTLLVRFDVPELFLGRLAVGQMIAVDTWAARGAHAEGRIVDIDSRIDPVGRTFVVRAHVDNTDDSLRPGMSFRVTLTLEGPDFPVVPEVAVQWGGDGAYVWIVEDQRAGRVPVNIVQRRDGRVLVDADLDAGMQVVLEGVQRMREGLEVSVVDPDTSTGVERVVARHVDVRQADARQTDVRQVDALRTDGL